MQPSIAASISEMRKPAIEKRINEAILWFSGLPKNVFETSISEQITKAVFKKLLTTGERYVKIKMKKHMCSNSTHEFKVRSNPQNQFSYIEMDIHIDQELFFTVDKNGFHFITEPYGKPFWFTDQFYIIYFELIE